MKLFLNINKRHKIIITAFLLAVGLFSSQYVPFFYRFQFIIGIGFLAYLLSLWSLWQGINKLKSIVLLALPTLFTLAVAGYYFLIIPFWLRLLTSIFFGLAFYCLLLSQNIFNVSSIRIIPLYRVAFTVVFVITIATSILLFNDIFSLNLFFTWNFLAVFLLSFPLGLQLLWIVEMEQVSKLMMVHSLVVSLVAAELAVALSFWPVYKPLQAVMVGASLFITLGILIDSLRERMGREEVWEFLAWGGLVFIVVLLFTSWTG